MTSIPYIIIMSNDIIYTSSHKDFLEVNIIDKVADIMYTQYDNELSSYDDFIYRQKKLPNIMNDIHNSDYLPLDSETINYKNFIAKNFNNINNKEVIKVLYFDNNEWKKYNISPTLAYNIYKIRFL
jgi:hypothetical protein